MVVSSRTYDQARGLAEMFKARAVQWYERMKVEPDILINATPIGMHPNVDETPFDADYLQRGDDRVRHGVQPGTDAAGQGGPRNGTAG